MEGKVEEKLVRGRRDRRRKQLLDGVELEDNWESIEKTLVRK
jgi:hypothetical protein